MGMGFRRCLLLTQWILLQSQGRDCRRYSAVECIFTGFESIRWTEGTVQHAIFQEAPGFPCAMWHWAYVSYASHLPQAFCERCSEKHWILNQLTLSTSPAFPCQFNSSLVLVAPALATCNLHCTQTLSFRNPSSPVGQDINHWHHEWESLATTRLMESPKDRWDGKVVHQMILKI